MLFLLACTKSTNKVTASPSPDAKSVAAHPPLIDQKNSNKNEVVSPKGPDWQKAMELQKQGKFDDAVSLLSEIASKNQGSDTAVEALIEAGNIRFSQGKSGQKLHRNSPEASKYFKKAKDLFQQAAAVGPQSKSHARAKYMIGSADYFLWDLESAKNNYAAVVQNIAKSDPYHAKAALRYAQVQFSLLNHADAIRTIKELDPSAQDAAKLLKYADLFGKPAPKIEYAQLLNTQDPSAISPKGKPIALYFFTTWCPNCKKEIDFLNDIHKRYQQKGLTIVGITNTDRGVSVNEITDYIKKAGFQFPIVIDKDNNTSKKYTANSIPNIVLVDKNGTTQWHDHPASLPDSTIEKLLD